MYCDLASLGSVRRCAAALRDSFGPIRLLINNAGMVSSLRRMSIDGLELTFAINHLGPFRLTRLLLDRLDPGCGRILTVASRIHYRARIDLAQVRSGGPRYRGTAVYAQMYVARFTLSSDRTGGFSS